MQPQEYFDQFMPAAVKTWLTDELKRNPSDVRTININNNVRRDRQREIAENSDWKFFTPGNQITVSLVMADYSLHTKMFDRRHWNKATQEPEEKPE